MEFFYESPARYLSSERRDFHILEAIWRRKIVKMVNLGKEIENEKKLICSTSLVGHRMLGPLSLAICHGFKKNAEKHVVHG